MPSVRNPLQVLKEARQIASDYDLTIIEKAGRFHVYCNTQTGLDWQGQRGQPQALRALVCKAANFR